MAWETLRWTCLSLRPFATQTTKQQEQHSHAPFSLNKTYFLKVLATSGDGCTGLGKPWLLLIIPTSIPGMTFEIRLDSWQIFPVSSILAKDKIPFRVRYLYMNGCNAKKLSLECTEACCSTHRKRKFEDRLLLKWPHKQWSYKPKLKFKKSCDANSVDHHGLLGTTAWIPAHSWKSFFLLCKVGHTLSKPSRNQKSWPWPAAMA